MTVSIFIMPVKLELPTIKILTSISLTLSDYKTETRNQVSILKQLLAFWHSVLFLLIGWIWTWHLTAKNLNSRNEETSQSIWGLILAAVNKVNLVKIFSSICWSVNLGALVRGGGGQPGSIFGIFASLNGLPSFPPKLCFISHSFEQVIFSWEQPYSHESHSLTRWDSHSPHPQFIHYLKQLSGVVCRVGQEEGARCEVKVYNYAVWR